jgi:hypothetical protein
MVGFQFNAKEYTTSKVWVMFTSRTKPTKVVATKLFSENGSSSLDLSNKKSLTKRLNFHKVTVLSK